MELPAREVPATGAGASIAINDSSSSPSVVASSVAALSSTVGTP